ncbi:hypothetical protein LWI29_019357 [Acer saccharum]|uniref:Uncharacterized protein n=1 Tax=Acer saccharum TaxID=4024 RepID=A0AA39VR15_ACESA|nr:hypothetical protein LWI29_019357 [Acer saccharum]
MNKKVKKKKGSATLELDMSVLAHQASGSVCLRVYCAEALEPINNDIVTDKDDIATEEKPRREDSGEIVSSMNSNEGSSKGLEVNTRDKAEKGKKGKRLRKRKSNPVKKLMNVKSC